MHTAIKKLIFILRRRRRPDPVKTMARLTAPAKSGFTLAEVVVASTLLAIALVPILKAMVQVNMYSVILERRTQSLCLAQTKLNKIQAKSIYNFDGISSQNNEVLSNAYLCNTTSQTVNSNLKTITISVGMDRNSSGTLVGNEIEITLQTRVARRW